MKPTEKEQITVIVEVKAPVEVVWLYWTTPVHITRWNQASDDWHTVLATNDLRKGGRFSYRMEASDGSTGFDFGGVYKKIITNELIEYLLDDDRYVSISFLQEGEKTIITETFETETVNTIELQRFGWQSILNNFRNYIESNYKTN